ncbi:PHA/PHB synthase family protein [Marinobacterium weihaiense]|uniref:Class I poly(R)-hydroxyalkanoic acid synthase n=1 Tax=Marinobacterium weihaiense TaxID=2851016 RepID=A0ABS6M6Q7_9GAMM|nr:class I poly(R)-hydroxyalkanoic acid synthase [Marinobacterium weihaiense]MBV0931957.1 class I poly(R)-hydroxyalkanoic acid synthase [Marinobacterium weihaiense]
MTDKDENTLSTDPQEFINYVNRETGKVLEMFSATGGDDILRQFTQSWTELATRSLEDPTVWIRAIADYQQAQFNLWRNLLSGKTSEEPIAEPSPGDRRFKAEEWSKNPVFDYIKQSYLLTSQMLTEMAHNAKLSPAEQQKLEFYTRQYVDALSPTNFALTNPEVLQQALETKGASLVEGLKNLLSDIDKGRISMTDESAFELGTNLATTEGAVVFQNHIFQLIHYKPLTEQTFERPTLIVPPSINKYYILDLQPDNSFVRYALEQGQDVYLISWNNPSSEERDLSWDDYVGDGVIKAIEITKRISGQDRLNAVSWCVGGTLMASALAVLANRKDNSVSSCTFLTTLLDFSDPGDLCVYIDQHQVKHLESKVNNEGILHGRELATSFNMLRSNDLIWSYVVNNYLKGQTPPPFDILYWNSDPTNLPAEFYTYYINRMYLENKLVQPDALTMCGEPIDLRRIKTPCYFLSTMEDHIAPWKGTFKALDLFANVEFVLGASGHVAGVINPAKKNRRNYWIKGEMGKGPEAWLESAERHEGSWWGHWSDWLRRRAGKKVDAPSEYGTQEFPVLEAAPGSYVRKRLD